MNSSSHTTPASLPPGISTVLPDECAHFYRSYLELYPFRVSYIGKLNPYTRQPILTAEDYDEYLRERAFRTACEQQYSNQLSVVRSDLESDFCRENQRLRDSYEKKLSSAITAAEQDYSDKLRHVKRSWLSRFSLLLSSLLLIFVLCLRWSNNRYDSLLINEYNHGYSDAVSGYDDALSSSYSQGFKDGTASVPVMSEEPNSESSSYAQGFKDGMASVRVMYEESSSDSSSYAQGFKDGMASVRVMYEDSSSSSSSQSNGVVVRKYYHTSSSNNKNQSSSSPVSDSTSYSYKIIGNKNTKKYHDPDCSYLPYESNRVSFSSASAAEASGYIACAHCGG